MKYATPRYNYNQIMCRLDLNDPRLYLPVPVYIVSNVKGQPNFQPWEAVDSLNSWKNIDKIPFFAIPPNRGTDGLIAVYQGIDKGKIRLHVKPSFRILDFEAKPVLFDR